jgi:hypothetical protein
MSMLLHACGCKRLCERTYVWARMPIKDYKYRLKFETENGLGVRACECVNANVCVIAHTYVSECE